MGLPSSRLLLAVLAFAAVSAAAAACAVEDDEDDASQVTQDELGVLHGKVATLTKPLREHPRPPLQHVRSLHLTPDATRLVLHEWRRGEGGGDTDLDRVVVVDVAGAKVLKVLVEEQGVNVEHRPMRIADDGRSVLVGEPEGLHVYDLTSGKRVKEHPAPKGKYFSGYEFSGDGRRAAAGVLDDARTVIWDVATGEPTIVRLDFVPRGASAITFPLAGRSEILVLALGDREGEKTTVSLLEPKSGKRTTLAEFEGNADVLPTRDGKRAYVMRQEDPQHVRWTAIEEWDLATAKRTRRFEMKPPLSSIGLVLSRDGNTLFLHEYLAQPVTVWDLKRGKLVGIVAPELGGCQSFAISPDGSKLVAFIGPWKQGTLIPEKLAVYDTSALIAGGR